MKKMYLAAQNIIHDMGFVVMLLLELTIGVFFLSSALGSIISVYDQINLCNDLRLSQSIYMANGEYKQENAYPMPMKKNLYLPYGEKNAELSIISSTMCEKLGFSLDNTEKDVLDVIVNDRFSKTYKTGEIYTVGISSGKSPIHIKIVGTYEDMQDILDKDTLSGNILTNIYSDFICSRDSEYFNEHNEIVQDVDMDNGMLYIFDNSESMRKFQQQTEGAVSLSEQWKIDFWGNETNIFLLITSVIFLLLSIAAVVSSKVLRALTHRKRDSIFRMNGAQTKQLLLLSCIEDSFLFLPLFLLLYLIVMGKNYILSATNGMTIVYLNNHPTWNFLKQLVDPISNKTILIAVCIYFFLYLVVSCLVYYSLNKRNIAQTYGDLGI